MSNIKINLERVMMDLKNDDERIVSMYVTSLFDEKGKGLFVCTGEEQYELVGSLKIPYESLEVDSSLELKRGNVIVYGEDNGEFFPIGQVNKKYVA